LPFTTFVLMLSGCGGGGGGGGTPPPITLPGPAAPSVQVAAA
jgi:hypothetical protein